ncbi:MAG: alpha/beta hydrolase family esterase [Pseudomonadales bacterium]
MTAVSWSQSMVSRLTGGFFLGGILLLGLVLSPESSAVCQKPPMAEKQRHLAIGSMERVYRVHVPPGYSEVANHPLVLMLHGWGGDENTFLEDRLILDPSDARGFVLVAPRGLGSGPPDNSYGSWTFNGSATGLTRDGGPICDTGVTPDYRYASCKAAGIAKNACAWTHCQNLSSSDAEFIEALLKEVEALLCIDPARIFVFGGSNGGNAIWDFADRPRLSEKLAAISSLIGLPHKSYIDGDLNNPAPPALLITGTEDPTDPPGQWESFVPTTTSNEADRFYYESASATMRAWSQRHGCEIDKAAARVAAPEPFDCRSYCPGGIDASPALDCRIEMGHVYQLENSWPLTLDFFLNRARVNP